MTQATMMQRTGAPEKVTRFPGVAPSAPARGAAETADANTLVVGPDIALNGDIAVCARLIVDGRVDGTLETGGSLVVRRGGAFSGSVTVAEADIDGVFDGRLRVSGTLVIRPGGRVSGDIRYGSLRIEAGGEICGQIDAGSSDEPAPKVA